jgi:hypothetical protein
MFTITFGDYSISMQRGTLPNIYSDYRKHAALAEEFDLRPHEGELCFISVSRGQHWPVLVVAQRFQMADAGFDPAAILVPETVTLFVGAGRRLLGYKLDPPQRLWEDVAESGFWEWSQQGDTILMSAELELAAWDLQGVKRWSMPLEPAWAYHLAAGMVHLNAMGRKTVFPLRQGPGASTRDD